MEGGKVGCRPEEALEILSFGIQNKSKIFMDLAVQSVGKHKPTVFLVLSDGLKDVKNFLIQSNTVNIADIDKDNSIIHSPTVLAQPGRPKKTSRCPT